MIVLGIESSCDETAAALVQNGTQVLSSLVSSQVKDHQRFGGVVPEIAARKHLENISPLVEMALVQAGLSWSDIEAVAVTRGPGLMGALLVGLLYAQGVSLERKIPLIPVNHVHAHIYSAFLNKQPEIARNGLTLALVVSGGHTNFYLMNEELDLKLIGYSLDDACGECFDKVARILALGYPGGPAIEKKAQLASGHLNFEMPRSMANKDLFLSYSGLKTHMVQLVRQNSQEWLDTNLGDLAHAFQVTAFDQILRKIKIAAEKFPIKRIILAGGVAANLYLRGELQKLGIPVLSPELRYCGDNAAMIACMAYFTHQKKSDFSLEPFSRYPFSSELES